MIPPTRPATTWKSSYLYTNIIHHGSTDPLLYITILLALMCGASFYKNMTRPTQRRLRVTGMLATLLGALSALYAVFVVFRQHMCPVEESRITDTVTLALMAHNFLSNCSAASGMYYWMDYGTLLTAVRSGKMMPWDPDADFGTLIPQDVDSFVAQLKAYSPENVRVTYDADRLILQMRLRNAHCDIWFFQHDSVDNLPAMSHFDYTNKNPTRFIKEVLPTKTIRFLGQDVPIPADAHKVLRDEFGPTYLTPVVTTMECFECVLQGRAPRTWYNAMLMSFLLGSMLGYAAFVSAFRISMRN